MKFHRLPRILIGLALFGALLGFFLSTERSLSFFSAADAKIELEASDLAAQVESDFPVKSINQVGIQDLVYPNNAIPGELVFHFDRRQYYLAYVKMLVDAGIAPLGQIDELLAVRISESISFILGSLGPGQTTTRKIHTQIPSLDGDETLNLVARVIPKKLEDDIRLNNNLKSVTFRSAK